jgi:gluconokinase
MHALTGRLRMSYCEAGWTGNPLTLSASCCGIRAQAYFSHTSPISFTTCADGRTHAIHCIRSRPVPCMFLTLAPGLFDRERRTWNAAALESAANLQPNQLPELYDACAPDSSLPLLPSCPLAPLLSPRARVLPPISDGAAANLGAGCVDNTCACLTVGTSIALRTVVRSCVPPVISSSGGLWSYHLHDDLWLVGGALSDGGNLVAWLLKTMNFDADTWESEVAGMPPGSHGLVVLPFASGERSTGYRGDASFHISGAKTSSSPTQVMRATMEAVALRARALWQRMLPYMQPNACVVASGGALMSSKCWSRMFCDAMGVPVTVCGENKEASIMGIVSQCTTHLRNIAAAPGR